MHLDSQLLNKFIHAYYGYGNFHGKYWFIGMEEGGGNSIEEVNQRLEIWQEFGCKETVDLAKFHLQLGMEKYFTGHAKLQRTWMQLVRIVLSSKEYPIDTDKIRMYQRDKLGRKDQETLLLELFPLPSKNSTIWNYNEWSSLPFLKNRNTYQDYCLSWRINHLRTLVTAFQPPIIVFYGMKYKKYWQNISGQKIQFTKNSGVWVGKSKHTLFIIMNHPSYQGIENAYFNNVGVLINSQLEKLVNKR